MKTIGTYRIVDGPFKGGFGEVYKVFDTSSGDEFALKGLQGSFVSSSERLVRFRAEIRAWLDIPVHPNVVRAIKAFDHGGRPYVVSEWISGGDLRGAFATFESSAQALVIVTQICEGMSHIHRQGLVHGDLKPSNVMMWAGESPQITDFGFARAAGAVDRRSVGGTERYLAPEASSGSADLSIDIFAAGVTFQEMLDRFPEHDFGVAAARKLAHDMTRPNPATRPATFDVVLARLQDILAAAPHLPTVARRHGDRRTWEETHMHPVAGIGLMSEARSLHAAGRRAESRAKLGELLLQDPSKLDARVLLAHGLIEDGEPKAALEHIRIARTLAKDEPEELVNIAFSLLDVGQLEEAAEIAATAPESARLWYLRASLANRQGSLSDALEFYQKALDTGGDHEVRLGFAIALREAGRQDAAISELQAIGTEHPDAGVRVAFLLARIYADVGRYDDAAAELSAVLRDHGPENQSYAYVELGYMYRKQGLFKAAISSYQKALAINPENPEAQEGLDLSFEAAAKSGATDQPETTSVRASSRGLDARLAYATLAELEHRLEHDRFEDIAPDQTRVTWSFLTNEYVIPLLLKTERISRDESEQLDRIRRRPRREPERDEDGIDIYPDIYELLLTLRGAFEMFDERAFRGHPDYRSSLIPSVFMGADAERPHRLERTFDFVKRLASMQPDRNHDTTGSAEGLLGLLATAQHCGLPTTLLEFSSDVRMAASHATAGGTLGEVGEIVMVRPRDLEPLAVVQRNPYGRFIQPAPSRSIAAQKSLFIEGAIPAVLNDPDTTCIERYRFRQDGRPFPAVGGYGPEELMKSRRELATAVRNTPIASDAATMLNSDIESYAVEFLGMTCNTGGRATATEYALACATWLASQLSEESTSLDRTVAKMFVRIQSDLHETEEAQYYVKHVRRAAMAFESYLSATGDLDQRLAAGIRGAWLSGSEENDELVLTRVDHYLPEYFQSS